MESKYKTQIQYGNWIICKNDKALNNIQTLHQLQSDEIQIKQLKDVIGRCLSISDLWMPADESISEEFQDEHIVLHSMYGELSEAIK